MKKIVLDWKICNIDFNKRFSWMEITLKNHELWMRKKKLSEIILEFLIDGYDENTFGFGSWCMKSCDIEEVLENRWNGGLFFLWKFESKYLIGFIFRAFGSTSKLKIELYFLIVGMKILRTISVNIITHQTYDIHKVLQFLGKYVQIVENRPSLDRKVRPTVIIEFLAVFFSSLNFADNFYPGQYLHYKMNANILK